MGSSNSNLDNSGRNLYQETAFIKYLTKFGKEFSANIEIPFNIRDSNGVISEQKIKIHSTPESTIDLRVSQIGDFSFERVTKSLIMSVCAFQGRPEIDNVLDGYNSAFIIIVENTNQGSLRLKFTQKAIQDDMFQRELIPFSKPEKKNGNIKINVENQIDNNITDVISKKIYCWEGGLWSGFFNRKISFWNLIRTKTMTDRITAHLPIWCQGYVWFSSMIA